MKSSGQRTPTATPHRGARPGTGPGYLPKHAPRMPFALLVGGLLAGGMCALLALNTASAANELARHQIAGKDSDVSGRLEQVRNQVAASAAPGSLGQAATALGMVPAGSPAFLKIGADGRVVLLGSPASATAPPAPPAPVVHKAIPTKKATATKATKPKTTAKKKPVKPTATPTPTTTLPGGTR